MVSIGSIFQAEMLLIEKNNKKPWHNDNNKLIPEFAENKKFITIFNNYKNNYLNSLALSSD